MLDFFRDLRKSSDEKAQEALTAYLDGALTPQEQGKLEKDLAQNADLSAQLEQMRALKQEMRQLPQRQVPRNFTLDPAAYGRPAKEPLIQAYPVLRTATVLTAFIFIFVLAANLFLAGTGFQSIESGDTAAMIAEPEMEAAGEETMGMEAASEMAAEEAAPQEESEEAADEAIGGEMELPLEAQEAMPMEVPEQELRPLPTMAPDDQARQQMPEVESTIVADESIAAEAPGATTLDTETEPGLLPEEGLAQVEPAPDSDLSSMIMADVINLNLFTLLLVILGIIFIILLFFTLLARRRL